MTKTKQQIKNQWTPEQKKALLAETNRIAAKPQNLAKLVSYLKETGQIKQ